MNEIPDAIVEKAYCARLEFQIKAAIRTGTGVDEMRATLAAVYADIQAEALREAADELEGLTQEAAGVLHTHWRGRDFVDGLDAAYEHSAQRLRTRADRLAGA